MQQPPGGPSDPLDVLSSYAATPKTNRYLANSKSSSNLYYNVGGGVNQLNNNVILPSASSSQPFSVEQVRETKVREMQRS